MVQNILPQSFYLQDTRTVAEQLIGKLLVRKYKGTRLSGLIVETEAYRGFDDTASHAHKGPTDRCEVMFGEAGHAYIYLTYGIHHMLNFVTERKFYPSAVLIRAIEPIEGIESMKKNRDMSDLLNLTSGPAKLTKALNIDRSYNGIDITNQESIWVEEPVKDNARWKENYPISTTTRIGIDYADKWARGRLWRFYVKNNPHVSRK